MPLGEKNAQLEVNGAKIMVSHRRINTSRRRCLTQKDTPPFVNFRITKNIEQPTDTTPTTKENLELCEKATIIEDSNEDATDDINFSTTATSKRPHHRHSDISSSTIDDTTHKKSKSDNQTTSQVTLATGITNAIIAGLIFQ